MTNNDETFSYIGDELEVFQHAVNWKDYWCHKISPYVGSDILEVGAGIGGTTRVLAKNFTFNSFLGIEPDAQMVEHLHSLQAQGEIPASYAFEIATINDLPETALYDTILYIDVLEHLEFHAEEVQMAQKHLKKGGYLVILSPAYNFLYTEFDKAIGHYRRYNRPMMHSLTPAGLRPVTTFNLDMVGLLASAGNLLVLKSPQPSLKQILFWDRVLVPISRIVDRLFFYRFGRSIIQVWQKTS